jgi:hypothetical protein
MGREGGRKAVLKGTEDNGWKRAAVVVDEVAGDTAARMDGELRCKRERRGWSEGEGRDERRESDADMGVWGGRALGSVFGLTHRDVT